MHERSRAGRTGEDLVANYLVQHGFTILAANYRQQYGEIDLIASFRSMVVFVEVKMRSHTFDDWSEVIRPSKQRKIIQVAKRFMASQRIENMDCRFDVAFVHGSGESAQITYMENAFCGDE